MSTALSVVFTDLVGFTTFTEARGDAAAVVVLEEARRIVDRALDGSDGRVVKEIGDGVMLAFDDASGSIERTALLAHGLRTGFTSGQLPLPARVGLHRGEVVRRGDDLIGHTVNVTARVVDVAGPGELLVSDVALDACGDLPGVHAEPVGPVRVRGVREPIWLHRVALV
jgi:class 3 adenylate cyclase